MSNSHTFLPRILSRALCVALLTTSAFAQDDKPKTKSEPAAEKKDSSKKKKAPVTPRDEATALKEFKAEMLKIKAWTDTKQNDAATSPVEGIKMIREMSAKVADVRTDGLPEDLATPFGDMTETVGKMAEIFKDMPTEADEFQKWMVEKATADPKFAEQLQTDMQKLGAQAEKASNELKEAGAKYGIDLDFDKKKGDKDKEEGDDKKDGDDAKDKEEKEEKEK